MRLKGVYEQDSVTVPAGGTASASYSPPQRVNKIVITPQANTSVTSAVFQGKDYGGTGAGVAVTIDVKADFGEACEGKLDVSFSNAGTADETAVVEIYGVVT